MTEMQSLTPLWIAQSTLALALGLAAAAKGRTRAATAHALLLLAMIAVLLLPLANWTVRHAGLGVLSPTANAQPPKFGMAELHFGAALAPKTDDRPMPPIHAVQLPANPAADLSNAAPRVDTTVRSRWSVPPTSSILTILWGTLSVGILVRLGRGIIHGFEYRRHSTPVATGPIVDALRAAGRDLGINRPIALRSTSRVACPMICCWGEPCILIPVDLPEGVDWRAVMAHELAHLIRRDHLAASVAELVCCILPWHPFAWLARNRLAALAERSCDDWALGSASSRTTYAKTLVAFVASAGDCRLTPAIVSRSGVAARIADVLGNRARHTRIGRTFAVAAVFTALSGVTMAALAQPGKPKATVDSNPAPSNDVPAQIESFVKYWRDNPTASRRGEMWDRARQLSQTKDPRIIPPLVGMIDADNSYDTVYGVGYFGLAKTTGVDYSPYHDGAWWKRWWQANKSRFPEAVQKTPIPEFPKTAAGRNHVPFPESLDTFDGKIAWLLKEFAAAPPVSLSLSDIAQDIAKHKDARAIPTMIGVIDADNSYGTVYGIGYFGLSRLAKVNYSPYHDGAWWRRWWNANKQRFPADAQAIAIPKLPKTPHGAAYTPMPESFDTLNGKVDWLNRALEGGRAVNLWDFAKAMADHKDPRAIPMLIGIVRADNTEQTIYGVGHFGLAAITGVKYDASHNGPWWERWWDEHKNAYPAEVQQTPLPFQNANFAAWTAAVKRRERADDDAEFAGFPSKEIRAAGDDRKRYFLLGPGNSQTMPRAGWKLLLILPGGDGGPAFHPFCRRIHRNALPDGFVAAELVAPVWSKDVNRIVWPTRPLKDPAAAFTTEDFIQAVVKDVATRVKIDPRHVLALGWSSSGPALYCDSLQMDSPVTGWFVAMSVFRPNWMPDLAAAKNRRYYILHSPDDKLIPIDAHARQAEQRLKDAGAAVKLVEYTGGHGWTEDPFRHIRQGVQWLEGNPE